MPTPGRNGLGVFGLLVALVGLAVPTGIVSFLGLMLSLVAVGRAPRGAAAIGVMLGLVGTVAWMLITVVAVGAAAAAGIVALVGMAVAFALTQPEVIEVTSDMVNLTIAAKEYEQDEAELPASLDDLRIGDSARTDPWGTPYRLAATDEGDLGFELVSAGGDTVFGTEDDILLSRLDRLWEAAFESFEDRMETFGERLEHLDGSAYAWRHEGLRGHAGGPRSTVRVFDHGVSVNAAARQPMNEYEKQAVASIEGDERPTIGSGR
jgi:hypothetical protein